MVHFYLLSHDSDLLCYRKQTCVLFVCEGGPGRVVNGAFMVLKGHRSIVNQVRFNPHTYMICSSGVEKVIKVSNELLHTLRGHGSTTATSQSVRG